ncbi:MAG: 1,4-alpha-glucan branching protein GlgB [Bacilli bacterium]|nr:1,4-alpha-glucan branching protein GlgB [Bacilli bacterium]
MKVDKIPTKYHLYNYYGCHFTNKGFIFRLYAPHATKVSVIGDFNNWNENTHVMNYLGDGNYEVIIPSAMELDNYKYVIWNNDLKLYKADPFASFSDLGPNRNSRIYSTDEFKWQDYSYLHKVQPNHINKPLNIYECNLGSWKRHLDGSFYTYKELKDELIPYVKKMGYTHIELMPISEFPFDGSWGYQVTGFYAITARYGEPYDFMEFVNAAHREGIGVIVDWVPAHFCKDEEGLIDFDGKCLYEYRDPLKKERQEWGTRIFDFESPYVQDFLISAAMMYVDLYHVDGIRVDAVASMLYLDFGKREGEWKPNRYGEKYCLEAIDFIKNFNVAIHEAYPNVITIAEESTSFAGITTPVYLGGLGFDFKWNMGWMHDTLNYMQSTTRWGCHHNMSFSLDYAYNENYILPLSHDEVVHGKKSILDKMPGEYDQKFNDLRAYYGYMMTHPGKKLTFMGVEIAQFIEWNYTQGLDWILLKYPRHNQMQKYFADLNKFYLKHSELWELDQDTSGFEWIKEDNGHEGYIYKRFNKNREELLILLNFNMNDSFIEAIDTIYNYEEVFNSNRSIYGGNGKVNKDIKNINGKIEVFVEAQSIVILKRVEEKKEEVKL